MTARNRLPKRPIFWAWAIVAIVLLAAGTLLAIVTYPVWGQSQQARDQDLLIRMESDWGVKLPDGAESIETETAESGFQGDGTAIVLAHYASPAQDLAAATVVPTATVEPLECTAVNDALAPLTRLGFSCENDFSAAPFAHLSNGYDQLWLFWLEGRIVLLEATT